MDDYEFIDICESAIEHPTDYLVQWLLDFFEFHPDSTIDDLKFIGHGQKELDLDIPTSFEQRGYYSLEEVLAWYEELLFRDMLYPSWGESKSPNRRLENCHDVEAYLDLRGIGYTLTYTAPRDKWFSIIPHDKGSVGCVDTMHRVKEIRYDSREDKLMVESENHSYMGIVEFTLSSKLILSDEAWDENEEWGQYQEGNWSHEFECDELKELSAYLVRAHVVGQSNQPQNAIYRVPRQRAKVLQELSEMLDSVSFKKVTEYRLIPSQLRAQEEDNESLESWLSECQSSVGFHIYIISHSEKQFTKEIYKSFRAYKAKPKRVHQLSKDNEIDKNHFWSPILYVGSKQKELHTRMKQHLGLVAPTVYSLHLKEWFPEQMEVKIQVFRVNTQNPYHLEFLEQGFWDDLMPLFGKKSGH